MPEKLLRAVGLRCFIDCFEDFRFDYRELQDRADTIEAMFARGGAKTDKSAETKACNGVRIFRDNQVEEALRRVIGSRIPADLRDRARTLLAEL